MQRGVPASLLTDLRLQADDCKKKLREALEDYDALYRRNAFDVSDLVGRWAQRKRERESSCRSSRSHTPTRALHHSGQWPVHPW